MRRLLRRALRWVLLAILAIVLGYEEIQWRLSFVFAWLGKLPVLRQLESWVRDLPPYGALALFLVPTIVLFPLKLLAVYWIAAGKKYLGLLTILSIKVFGTAMVARIFQLCKTALLSIGWCEWLYLKVMALRESAYGVWKGLPIVRWWKMRWAREKEKVGFWRRLWGAMRTRVRRAPGH